MDVAMVTSSAPFDPAAALRGTPVVPGLAYGPVVLVAQEVSPEAIAAYADHADAESALTAYDDAAEAVAEGFSAKAARASGAATEVLTASAGLTRDKGLRQAVAGRVEGGTALLEAVHEGVAQFVDIFTAMGGLMAERATDLLDIERRLVARLVGEPEPGVVLPDVPSVLVASDLAPADTAGLDPALVLALVTEKGGATSHTAIIARQLGIPCVVGVAGALGLPAGGSVLVDATAGHRRRVRRRGRREGQGGGGPCLPRGGGVVDRARRDHRRRARQAARERRRRSSPPGTPSEAPVEGVGLFRTELCFLDRRDEPSVDDQAAIYGEVLDAFKGDGQYVVIRTLDAGSDKPIAFATLEDEENPALGVRGLRLALNNPGLLERQLDGIAAAASASGTETWVMAPMVATVAEARDFAQQVRDRGLKAGVMVEVPSAALLADQMIEVVDFLSIGTNDLTQYTMAADRLASDLAHLTDPWQPAVLQLIATTAAAGRRGRQERRRLRGGRGGPAAGRGADRHGDHLALDGVRRRTRRRRPAVRRLVGHLRGGRQGRPRRRRPDGRPGRRPRCRRRPLESRCRADTGVPVAAARAH